MQKNLLNIRLNWLLTPADVDGWTQMGKENDYICLMSLVVWQLIHDQKIYHIKSLSLQFKCKVMTTYIESSFVGIEARNQNKFIKMISLLLLIKIIILLRIMSQFNQNFGIYLIYFNILNRYHLQNWSFSVRIVPPQLILNNYLTFVHSGKNCESNRIVSSVNPVCHKL